MKATSNENRVGTTNNSHWLQLHVYFWHQKWEWINVMWCFTVDNLIPDKFWLFISFPYFNRRCFRFAILRLFIEDTHAIMHSVWKQTEDMALMWQWQQNEFVYFHCIYLCLRRSVVVIVRARVGWKVYEMKEKEWCDRKPHASYAEQWDLVSQCVRAAPWSLPLLSLFVYIFLSSFTYMRTHISIHWMTILSFMVHLSRSH